MGAQIERMAAKIVDLTNMTPTMTRELNEIAQAVRGDYMEFIDQLSQKYGNEEFWWDTQLASRHIGCMCFSYFCRLVLIREMYQRGEVDEVIVDTKVIGDAIKQNFPIRVTLKAGKESLRSRVWRIRLVQTLLNYRRFAGRARRFREDPSMRSAVPKNEEVVLVSECAIPSELKNGKFSDRYFPNMMENSPQKLLFAVNMVYGKEEEAEELSAYLGGHSEFAICDCFTTKEDLAEIRRYIRWCSQFKIGECTFKGLKVTSILQQEIRNSGYNSISIAGILKGNAICRMIKEQDLHVVKLIDWFEGQASSSAIVRRFRKSFPGIPTLSYINSPCGENNLGLYPIKEQYRNRAVSEVFGTQGICWESMMKRYCPEVRCVTVPSFRQLAVFQQDGLWEQKREGILITVPYFMDVAGPLLHDFFAAIRGQKRISVFIKNHPAKEDYRLSDYGIRAEEYKDHDIQYVTGALSDALRGKRAVIMSKTTMALEVMLTGVYTILYLARGELSNFCLPDGTEQYQNVACNEEELKELLSGDMKGLNRTEAEALRDRVFARLEEGTVNALLCRGEP